jgi:hypothetical protein
MCIAVDAVMIAADLKASEKRVEELSNHLALQKSTYSQTLKKLDENHTLMLEIRTRLLHFYSRNKIDNDGHTPNEYSEINHKYKKLQKSASWDENIKHGSREDWLRDHEKRKSCFLDSSSL